MVFAASMNIGPIQIEPPTIFAPLAGITNLPLRLLAKEAGCGLVCSEMVSAHGLVYGSEKTQNLLKSASAEKPLSVQLFGSDWAVVAEAAQWVAHAGADIVDINFGCSVKKILKSLKEKIQQQQIKIYISIGINRKIVEEILGYINLLGLQQHLEEDILLIFDKDVFKYLHKFNHALRHTDVLWTKPSELSFYCGLGIPILMAPPIGTHEENSVFLGHLEGCLEGAAK